MVWDVVVLGASIAGLSAARRLASHGYAAVVLDPNPPLASATIGHGVAACAHASTVARMAAVYGDGAAGEHVRRNLAGLEEIRTVAAAGGLDLTETELHDHSLGVALERELGHILEVMTTAGAQAWLLPGATRTRATAGLGSQCLLIDPGEYAATLTAQADAAGARLINDVTVTHIRRLDGITKVVYRPNTAWRHELDVVHGHAVIDTLGVTPWGALAGMGQPQYVPTLRVGGAEPPDHATLHSTPPVWLIRPAGDQVLLLGPKCTRSQLSSATGALANWARAELGASDILPGHLVIDPSDHGRPIVGASAIPGGFYTRGNGRGELMNGTASGCYLASLLLGHDAAGAVALPWESKLRAGVSRLFSRRRKS